MRFGDSTRTRVGDWVVAIGNPFGLGGTVTAGIVSALHRNIGAGVYDRYIQTDASINSGNSGGPMFDLAGNVIGINTALISPTGGNVGIGFAIPAEQIAPVVEQLRRGQQVSRGYIGVSMQDVDEGVAAALGLERNRGTLIRGVTPGGPAARAGIQQGDVIIGVAGQPVNPDQTLAYLLSQQRVGARVPVELIRERPAPHRHRRGRAAAERRGAGAPERRRDRPASRAPTTPQSRAMNPNRPASARRARASASPSRRSRPRSRASFRSPTPPCAAWSSPRSIRTATPARRASSPAILILSINQAATVTPEAVVAAVEAARRANRNTVLLLIRRGNTPAAYIGVDLTRATPAR